MVEIIEVDCYFVVSNFNSINENFVLYLYFMLFTKCAVVLKFCTRYNQCASTMAPSFSLSMKLSILIAWPFTLYNIRLINNQLVGITRLINKNYNCYNPGRKVLNQVSLPYYTSATRI